jgi:hypothetical protein
MRFPYWDTGLPGITGSPNALVRTVLQRAGASMARDAPCVPGWHLPGQGTRVSSVVLY